MKKYSYNVVFIIVFISGLFLISGCDKQVNNESGVLEGMVSIGPICPVERIPPDPGCLPTAETYKAYPVSIWSTDGGRKIALISPNLDGSYKTMLAPGNYLVILENGQSRIGSSNLPLQVTIISMEKTILNISIDTGIR